MITANRRRTLRLPTFGDAGTTTLEPHRSSWTTRRPRPHQREGTSVDPSRALRSPAPRWSVSVRVSFTRVRSAFRSRLQSALTSGLGRWRSGRNRADRGDQSAGTSSSSPGRRRRRWASVRRCSPPRVTVAADRRRAVHRLESRERRRHGRHPGRHHLARRHQTGPCWLVALLLLNGVGASERPRTWLLWAFRLLAAVLLVSIPIGLVLARIRPRG